MVKYRYNITMPRKDRQNESFSHQLRKIDNVGDEAMSPGRPFHVSAAATLYVRSLLYFQPIR